MFEIISALWPVFALILIGYVLRRIGFPGERFWQQAEKLTYYVLFPALLIHKLSLADMSQVALGPVALSVFLVLSLGAIMALILKPFANMPVASFSSVYQGSIRFNTYVGLAATSALLGSQGLAIAAVIVSMMIPLVNIYCILMFSVYLGQSKGMMHSIITMLKNPLIMSCVFGLLLNQFGFKMPGFSLPVLNVMGQAALLLGLLAVGAGLSFKVLLQSKHWLVLSSAIKLIVLPLCAYGVGQLFDLSALSLQILVLFSALPTATSAYILARQLGGDAPLMSVIITGQTLLSFITLPIILFFVV